MRALLVLLLATPALAQFSSTQKSGPVELVIPDGGVRVNLGADTIPVSGTVGVSSIPSVTVSSLPAVSGTVNIGTMPDVSGTVDARVTTAPGTFLAVAADNVGTRLGVDVANTPNVSVTNIPTIALQNGTQVALTGASLAAIIAATAERTCAYAVGDPDSFTVGTTAANIPVSPLTGRTAVTIWNLEPTRFAWCNPAGTASATAGIPIPPDGSAQKFEGLGGVTAVSCRCATSTCILAYLEETCSQPSP
jgi:hypothetical protein